jgi:hypothetical protein
MYKKARLGAVKPPVGVLIDLHGSWQDEREADKIIDQVKRARKNSKKLAKGF